MPSNPKNTRKCCVCREHADKSELIRFVKTCDGVVLDKSKKLDGRGVWVHERRECLEKLAKKKMLNAAFKCNVSDSIYMELNNERE